MFALMVAACAAYLLVITRPGGSPLSIRLVTLAIAVQTAVALAVPPSATEDLWWYAIYGRILAIYHASPYTHVAASYPHNPLLPLVGHTWRHTPSVYGPAFSALSGVVAILFGPSQLATRVFYQGLAAAALIGACIFVWRRTRSAEAVAFLALNPLTALYLVNGGRNDILVALSLVAAVVLVTRKHPVAGGVVGGLGALVKLTGLVGVVALCVSLVAMRRAARRDDSRSPRSAPWPSPMRSPGPRRCSPRCGPRVRGTRGSRSGRRSRSSETNFRRPTSRSSRSVASCAG